MQTQNNNLESVKIIEGSLEAKITSDKKFYFFYIYFVLFILVLNLLNLPIADEWKWWQYRPVQDFGFEAMRMQFFTHNARIGELLFIFSVVNGLGNDIFQWQIIMGIINTIITCSFFFVLFYLVCGKMPKPCKNDILLFSLMFLCIYFSSFLNESAVWIPGSFNYLLPIFLGALWLLPYRKYVSRVENTTEHKNYFSLKEIGKAIGFCLVSALIGMSNELFIPGLVCFWFFLCIYLLYVKKQIPPLWFFAGGCGLFIGWIFLVLSPGQNMRRSQTKTSIGFVYVFKSIFSRVAEPISIFSFITCLCAGMYEMHKHRKNIFFHKYNMVSLLCCVCALIVFLASFVVEDIPLRTHICFTVFLIVPLLLSFSHNNFLDKKEDVILNTLFVGFLFLLFIASAYIRNFLKNTTIKLFLTQHMVLLVGIFILFLLLASVTFFTKKITANKLLYVLKHTYILLFCFLALSVYTVFEYTKWSVSLKQNFNKIVEAQTQNEKNIRLPDSYRSLLIDNHSMYFQWFPFIEEYYDMDTIEFYDKNGQKITK